MARDMLVRDGAEVIVETGTGLVDKLEETPGRRNARVEFKATHTNLTEPVGGWLDTFDAEAIELVRRAFSERFELEYRIEVHRKDDVDPSIAIGQVPKRQKVRDLVSVRPVGARASAGNGNSPRSTPPPAPDAPQPAPTPTSPSGRPEATQAPAGGPTCATCGEPLAGKPVKRRQGGGYDHADCAEAPFEPGPAEALAEAVTAAVDGPKSQADDDGVWTCDPCQTTTNEDRAGHEATDAHLEAVARAEASTFDPGEPARPLPRVPLPVNRGPRQEEGRPWDRYNGDGSPNPGRFSLLAALACLEWAQDLCIYRARDLATSEGAQPHIDFRQVRSLGRTLLEASDRCQAAIRADGRIDRMDNSHTRARGAIRSAIRVYPVPWGASAEVKARWLDDLTSWAVALLEAAAELDA